MMSEGAGVEELAAAIRGRPGSASKKQPLVTAALYSHLLNTTAPGALACSATSRSAHVPVEIYIVAYRGVSLPTHHYISFLASSSSSLPPPPHCLLLIIASSSPPSPMQMLMKKFRIPQVVDTPDAAATSQTTAPSAHKSSASHLTSLSHLAHEGSRVPLRCRSVRRRRVCSRRLVPAARGSPRRDQGVWTRAFARFPVAISRILV
jgi:hypothetical protein